MTSPDDSIPSGAISSTGLAAYAAMTEDDWRDQQRAGLLAHFVNAESGFASILSNFQDLLDRIASKFGGGGSVSGATLPQVSLALGGVFNTLVETSQGLEAIRQVSRGADNSGMSYVDNFTEYDPVGPLKADWEVNYSGGGSSTISVVASGAAHWTTVANSNKSAIIRNQNYPTLTDYQYIGSTVSSGPDRNGAANYMFARMNSSHNDYVYAKFTSDGFMSYQCELGYCISGTRHVWVAATDVPLNTNNFLVAGTASDVDEYQVWSGNTKVFTYVDSGGNYSSRVDGSHRYWGWGGDVVVTGGHAYAPGDGVQMTAADHQPPSAVGSGMTAYRASTSNVSISSGTNLIPGSFFDNVVRQTADIGWDSSNNNAIVSIDGWYSVNYKILLNATYTGQIGIVLYRNGVVIQRDGLAAGTAHITGHFTVYLAAGDYVQPGIDRGISGANATGEATGTSSQFDIALLCRSLQ